MKLEPYSPCPCGSGSKFKFCCKGKPYEPSPELEADLALGQKLVAEYEEQQAIRDLRDRVDIGEAFAH